MSSPSDFVIENGVLKKYKGRDADVTIPEGVTSIGDSAFKYCSSLRSVTIPAGVTSIGGCAFSGCESLQSVTIPTGVTSIGKDAFASCWSLKSVTIPDSVTGIGIGAFDYISAVRLEMSIHCPVWFTNGRGDYGGSIINRSGSTIVFRDPAGGIAAKIVLANEGETGPKTGGSIISIRQANRRFDFEGYDAYFSQLAKAPNKIRIALARLEYPCELSDEWRGVYERYIRIKGEDAGKLLIDEDRPDLFSRLAEKGLFTAKVAAALLDYAAQKEKAAFTAILLDYTKTSDEKSGARAKKKADPFELEEIKDTEAQKKPEKTIAEWRKEFSFKYKDGGVFITGYLGDAVTLTIPGKIGGKYVIGICKGAFDFRSKKLRKIIIPGTMMTIETGAFEFYGDYHYMKMKPVTVEIAEGIRSLPNNAFGYLQNFTLRLPFSLTEISEQFSYADKKTIRLIVPESSPAEEFCKRYGLQYTTVAPPADGSIEAARKTRTFIDDSIKREAEKKAASPWKKPKPGFHWLGRYRGQESNVVFPLQVEGAAIDGIADTAGEAPGNYKTITSVVLPEGYTYIGKKAFAGCVALETISLPSTLRIIGGGAFGDCKKLKELILHKEVLFDGHGIFSGAQIDTLIMETQKTTKIPVHLFFGCSIGSLVVIGGQFKSNGNVFDYTGASAGASYAESMYQGNFPQNVYINGEFSTLDLKGIGGVNAKCIHPLADFDETVVSDPAVRALIAEEKKKSPSVDHASKVAETQTVDGIDFPSSVFVLSGTENEYDITAEIIQRGGTVKDGVSGSVDYLVVPDREIVKNSKIKKALELREKGTGIAIIRLSECRRHMRLYDEKVFGAEGADVAAAYRLSLENGEVTLLKYLGSEENVVVPSAVGKYPVTALGKGCFRESNKSKIKSVAIPDTVTVLPEDAFEYCDALKNVTLPEGLLKISANAFSHCSSLSEVNIPSTVTEIGRDAFSNCPALQRVYIPAGVHSVAAPFSCCDRLTQIVVDPANPVYDSRENCNAVIETASNTLVAGCCATEIPRSVTMIGASAFAGLDSIRSFSVPNWITEIGDGAFSGCMELKSVSLPDSLTRIGHYGFHFCSKLKKVALPPRLTEIGENGFGNCSRLTEITIPDSLQSAGAYCFYNCNIKKIYGSRVSLAKKIADAYHAQYVEF